MKTFLVNCDRRKNSVNSTIELAIEIVLRYGSIAVTILYLETRLNKVISVTGSCGNYLVYFDRPKTSFRLSIWGLISSVGN